MWSIAQAVVALALLVGLPAVLETPTSNLGLIAAAAGALVLVGLAFHGIARFVRSRKPGSFPDSIMPPKEPPRK